MVAHCMEHCIVWEHTDCSYVYFYPKHMRKLRGKVICIVYPSDVVANVGTKIDPHFRRSWHLSDS